MQDKSREKRQRILVLALLGVTGLYTAGFFSWYSGTLPGLSPVLDGKENLLLAEQMASGTLPGEPFYRAPLYPFILSLFLQTGLPADLLPLLARVLNGACHLLSTWLVFAVALRLWRSLPAAVLSAALVGLNPVLLHFAGDPLDITLGITWLLLALWQAVRSLEEKSLCSAALAGLFLILGAYTRPHLLMVALAWPVFLLFVNRKQAAMAVAPMVLCLLIYSGINAAISGAWKPLPTQGAYNLWAANKPEANGRYYRQAIDVSQWQDDGHRNPAQIEAEILYARETARLDEDSRPSPQAFWYRKTLTHVADNPGDWLSLMLRKAYYLLNDYEQYNNKTYSFHKTRSPWLSWNPLGWAVLLALGSFGSLAFIKRPPIRLIVVWGLAYALGVLLFYASARFRVPLVPLLAVLSGGVMVAIKQRTLREGLRLPIAAVVAVMLFIFSLTNLHQARDRSTYVEDKLLLAHAANELQRDAEMRRWAMEVIDSADSRKQQRAIAAELAVIAQYNRWVDDDLPAPDANALRQELQFIKLADARSPKAQWIGLVYLLKLDPGSRDHGEWQRKVMLRPDVYGKELTMDAAAVLILMGYDVKALPPPEQWTPLLRNAMKPGKRTPKEQHALDFLISPVAGAK